MKRYLVPTLILFWILSSAPDCQANELAIGKAARTAGPVDIEIIPLADLNFKSRADIFSLRKREVLKHANLLQDSYVPNADVFGLMEDKRPWWGTIGQAFYGVGEKSITGPAVQSQYILNPFLLVGLQGVAALPKAKVTEADLARTYYPTTFQATGLRVWPVEGKAEVTYQISSYMHQMCSLLGYNSFFVKDVGSLELINARDLGLNYVYIPPTWTYNMRVGAPMTAVMAVPQFVHCGGSCGYPGGCNNMSPSTAWLDDLEITKLPARVILMFWKRAPANYLEPPDMTYTMIFR